NQLRGDFEQQGGSSSLLVRADISVADALAQQAVADKEAERARAARAAKIKASAKEEDVPQVDDPVPAAVEQIRKVIDTDQRLGSMVVGEKNYYASMTSSGW